MHAIPDSRAVVLSRRQEALLSALCRAYVDTGEGIGSQELSRRFGGRWSPATVRAELGALAERGLVWAPHASAARKPTDRGLEYYALSIQPDRSGAAPMIRALNDALAGLEGARRRAAMLRAISAVADGAAVWVGRRRADGPIRAVDVVPVSDAVAVVVVEDARGEKLAASFDVDPAWRDRPWREPLQAGLRWLFVGRTMAQARARGRAILREVDASGRSPDPGDLAAAAAVGLAVHTSAMGAQTVPMNVEGRGRLASWLAACGGDVAGAMALLDAPEAVVELLTTVVCRGATAVERVHVSVGPPPALAPPPPIEHVAVFVGRIDYRGEEAISPADHIALLGPVRLDFARVLPLVEYAACSLMQEDVSLAPSCGADAAPGA